jgi:hypothetical protein
MLSPYDQTIQVWNLYYDSIPTTHQFSHSPKPPCLCWECMEATREADNRREEIANELAIACGTVPE